MSKKQLVAVAVVFALCAGVLLFRFRIMTRSAQTLASPTNTPDKAVPRELLKPVLVPDAHPGCCVDWKTIAGMLTKERTRVLVTNTAIGGMKLGWVELRFVARQADGTEAEAVPVMVNFAGRGSNDDGWGGNSKEEPWRHLIPYQLGSFGVGPVGSPRIRCPAFDGTLSNPLLAVLAQTPDLPPVHDRKLLGLTPGLAESRGALIFGIWYRIDWTLDPQWHKQGVSHIRIPDQIPPGQVAVFRISLDESTPDPFAAPPRILSGTVTGLTASDKWGITYLDNGTARGRDCRPDASGAFSFPNVAAGGALAAGVPSEGHVRYYVREVRSTFVKLPDDATWRFSQSQFTKVTLQLPAKVLELIHYPVRSGGLYPDKEAELPLAFTRLDEGELIRNGDRVTVTACPPWTYVVKVGDFHGKTDTIGSVTIRREDAGSVVEIKPQPE